MQTQLLLGWSLWTCVLVSLLLICVLSTKSPGTFPAHGICGFMHTYPDTSYAMPGPLSLNLPLKANSEGG